MNESFDPYRKWLGIPPDEQPPHHYRLLGIAPFETDREVIQNAADRQMGHVRRFQAGPYAVACQKLLNELAAARVCLLDPVRKREYDQRLFAEFQAAGKELPYPVAEAWSPEADEHDSGDNADLRIRPIPPAPTAVRFAAELEDSPESWRFSDRNAASADGRRQPARFIYRRRSDPWRSPLTLALLLVLFLMTATGGILLVIFREELFR
ncbi:MAG: hypothetical protein Kow0040_16850 [Thermogutta sp.]